MRFNIFKSGGYGNNGITTEGGVIQGKILLIGDPGSAMEASTKNYVDSKRLNINSNWITSGTLNVSILPAYTGDLTSQNGSNQMSLSNTGVNPGTYTKVSVDEKGRVVNGSNLLESDIPNLSWNKIVTGKPTSAAGYGIMDAFPLSGGIFTGTLKSTATPVQGKHIITKGYVDNYFQGYNNSGGLNTGDIVVKVVSETPIGFLKCNGGVVSKTLYSALYGVIGDTFNVVESMPGNGKPWVQQYQINSDSNDTLGSWVTAPTLFTASGIACSVVTKDRVYLIGGRDSNGSLSTVQTASINEDGTLGTWSTTTTLPVALRASQALVSNNRIYLLGGITSSAISTVYSAIINSDGSLGSWQVFSNLPNPLANSSAIITNNRIYLLGGENSAGSSTNVVYTCHINSDGTLGTWTTGTSLPLSVASSQAIVTKNRVYLIGGWTTVSVSNVYTAIINPDGTLGNWASANSLPAALSRSCSFVINNRVYVLGGWTTGSDSTVYTAPINEDGTLGTWATGSSLSIALNNSSAIITNSRIYLLGGETTAYTAKVNTALLTGGNNDYSAYYDGTITVLDTDTSFQLPDYSTKEVINTYTYIKT